MPDAPKPHLHRTALVTSLGAAAIGIENFVFMSGDDPKQGNHPDAVYVKDLDGVGLVKMAVGMRDQARFLSGDEIKQPPKLLIGATASPFTKPLYDAVSVGFVSP